MIATFVDLLPRVRYDLSEVSAITWSDDELYTYMKEGYKLIHNIISTEAPEWLLKNSNYTINKDNYMITLPEDCLFVKSINRDVDNVSLVKTTIEDTWRILKSTGLPTYWTRFGNNQVIISPNPDKEYNLTLFYLPLPQEITPTDEIPLPPPFLQFIIEYAIIRAHNRNERPSIVEQNFLVLKLDLIRSIVHAEGQVSNITSNFNMVSNI